MGRSNHPKKCFPQCFSSHYDTFPYTLIEADQNSKYWKNLGKQTTQASKLEKLESRVPGRTLKIV